MTSDEIYIVNLWSPLKSAPFLRYQQGCRVFPSARNEASMRNLAGKTPRGKDAKRASSHDLSDLLSPLLNQRLEWSRFGWT